MGITVDTSQLDAFRARIENLNTTQKEAFFDGACKEMAGRYLALVIPATPVGASSQGADGKTNHEGGTLRRGWSLNNVAYGQSGNGYTATVSNPTEYASYVEYGHRQTPGRYVPAIGKRLVNTWVEGQFFVKTSEEALEKEAPSVLNLMLDNFIRQGF